MPLCVQCLNTVYVTLRFFAGVFFISHKLAPRLLDLCCKSLPADFTLRYYSLRLTPPAWVISVVFSTFFPPPHIHPFDMLHNNTFTTGPACLWPKPPSRTSKFVSYIFISHLDSRFSLSPPGSLSLYLSHTLRSSAIRFFQFEVFSSSFFLLLLFCCCDAVSCLQSCLLYRYVEQYKISYFLLASHTLIMVGIAVVVVVVVVFLVLSFAVLHLSELLWSAFLWTQFFFSSCIY